MCNKGMKDVLQNTPLRQLPKINQAFRADKNLNTSSDMSHPSPVSRPICESPDIYPQRETPCEYRAVPKYLEIQLQHGVIQELPELVSGEYECRLPETIWCGWRGWPQDTAYTQACDAKTKNAIHPLQVELARLPRHVFHAETDFGPTQCLIPSFFQLFRSSVSSYFKPVVNYIISLIKR